MSTPDPTPHELCAAAIAAARTAGARYVEARHVVRTREALSFRNGALDAAHHHNDVGIGVRALVGDRWGYAATNALSLPDLAECGAAATQAAGGGSPDGEVPIPEARRGRYETPLSEDPFAVALTEKTALFAAADAAIRDGAPEAIKGSRGTCTSMRNRSVFLASNGTEIEQRVTLAGGGILAIAARGDEAQIRSHPKGFEGNILQGGFEHVRAMDLAGAASTLRAEALALLDAPPMPAGRRTVILDGPQLSLQIHESVGHPTELDRVWGEEISLAGASFLLPDNLDRLQYGSPLVNLTADATTPLGPGTFGFDDEGTPATRTPLVERGGFVGYLSGRESAARLGRASASCMRAESWWAIPIVRMINVNLEPGEGTLDDLIAGVDEGVVLGPNKSWSIDDLRLNFQFSTEIAYEIKGGRLTGQIFRNPLYWGVTPEFWRGCSAIAGPEAWRMWGWMYCGKGDPLQLMHVGHGCAPARFDDVQMRAST